MRDHRRHRVPNWRVKVSLIIGLALAAVVIVLFLPPIPQDPSYHLFADRREALGIPNFWNVASNLFFLIAGVAGLFVVARWSQTGSVPILRIAYLVFFTGVALTAVGSGFYHLNPSNATLVWDRLAMALTLMAFFSLIVGENISIRGGTRLLWPLIVLGLLAVVYWHFSELRGRGDLRPYVLVQFLPLLLIPAILLLFRPTGSDSGWIWLALFAYGAAKLAELADAAMFESVGFGGHALKHVLAALGAFFVLTGLVRRKASQRE